jgi:hypothetical protein
LGIFAQIPLEYATIRKLNPSAKKPNDSQDNNKIALP